MMRKPHPKYRAKELGCKSIGQVAEMSGVSLQTLGNWYKNKKPLFDCVCIGVATIAMRDELSEEVFKEPE